MRYWNQDAYLKAWNYSSDIHNGQTMPGSDRPYINHIGCVAMEALAAIANSETMQDPDLLVLCALLHDAIEDTPTTHEDIESAFGTDVADGVSALTKDKTLPSKSEQMTDSLSRIRQQPKAVWMVKLCDRITNLQLPPHYWDKEKIARYRDEARIILKQLGAANAFLAERLSEKIKGYAQYL